MMNYLESQQQDLARFYRDAADHRMTIKRDDGLYRHITMMRPQSSVCRFDITTIPGYLIYTGDMGAFVFSRTADMFDFHNINWSSQPTIDYGYWAQKCEAEDARGGVWDYDEAAVRAAAVHAFRQYDFGGNRMNLWHEFRHDVVEYLGEDEREDMSRVMDFSVYSREDCKTDYPFIDFYEYGPFRKPSLRFRWACWAIAYTVRQYNLGGDRQQRQKWHDASVLKGLA